MYKIIELDAMDRVEQEKKLNMFYENGWKFVQSYILEMNPFVIMRVILMKDAKAKDDQLMLG